jgi:hypothetical protein
MAMWQYLCPEPGAMYRVRVRCASFVVPTGELLDVPVGILVKKSGRQLRYETA